ncbi:hypothetical protein [Amycolatopsis speibonae]|uniref:Caspase family p20 domain-containing protein n=1 Tax=Amycolatopsis speibonae TaxID=1450224 RepID=A0ABV7NQH3_9PSEU
MACDQVWRRPETIARALAKVDATPEELDTPHRLSHYVSFRVDGYGHEESMRVRRLIRADHDGTSRFLFVIRCSSLTREPVVLFIEGCRPARFRADVPSSTCAFEFALDRTPAAGELAFVEFGVRFPPGQTGNHAQMAVFRPARDMALSVAFFQPRSASPPLERGEATFDQENRTFQFITLDQLPGQYGIRWSWA